MHSLGVYPWLNTALLMPLRLCLRIGVQNICKHLNCILLQVEPVTLLDEGIDMGHLPPGDETTSTFHLVNPCQSPVNFSLHFNQHGHSSDGSRPVLACRPCKGVLAAEQKQEVQVVFVPPCQGPAYLDEIHILVAGQISACSIPVKVGKERAQLCERNSLSSTQ